MKAKQYRVEALDNNKPLHPKGRDTVAHIQCFPLDGFGPIGLTHINCATSKCADCPAYPRPAMEKTLKQGDKKIYFYHYETLPTCAKCGPKKKRTIECNFCKKISKKGERKGRFGPCRHLVLKHKFSDVFWKEFYIVGLKRFQSHHWKKVVLGKRLLNSPRENVLDVLDMDILIAHDFTDALAIVHNNEIQSSHFGASCKISISIEGYSVLRKLKYDYALDFHLFLSDNNIQEARTVLFHLKKLFEKLIEEVQLKAGSRVLAVTDGCAKVCNECVFIFYLLYYLASCYSQYF